MAPINAASLKKILFRFSYCKWDAEDQAKSEGGEGERKEDLLQDVCIDVRTAICPSVH